MMVVRGSKEATTWVLIRMHEGYIWLMRLRAYVVKDYCRFVKLHQDIVLVPSVSSDLVLGGWGSRKLRGRGTDPG